MKREDIDKRIGMPDVDAEWARFEREVIAKDTKPRVLRVAAWTGGIGIAATIALLFVFNMGKENSEDQPLVAQLVEEQPLTSHPTPLTSQKSVPTTPSIAEPIVYDCDEISARFPGGDKALKAFIDSLFVCPKLAIDCGARGRVIVTFMVDTLGQTCDFRVARNRFVCDSPLLTSMPDEPKEQLREQLSEQLKEEAIRVLSQMPRWTPAKQFGKLVEQRWAVPVIFNGQEALQRPIAGLDIVPTSADLGSDRSMRLAGSDSIRRSDSIVVIINGTIQYVSDTLGEAYMRQHPEKMLNRRRIEGFVQSEDSLPLANAWVSCDTWEMGTATDSTGHFVMWAPRTVTQLNVRHLGYVPIRRNIQSADTILNFRMKDATKIKEVKVGSF